MAANNTNINIVLNAAALSALQSGLGSNFAFGGALTTITADGQVEGVFLTSSTAGTRQLIISTVPEPASLLLLASGLIAIGVIHRRKSHFRK
jgi:hypothetical protein